MKDLEDNSVKSINSSRNYFNEFQLVEKTTVSHKELNKLYEIESYNMKCLGLTVRDNDKILWQKTMLTNLKEPNFKLFIVYLNGDICAFATLFIKDEQLWVSEIELSEKSKYTKIIFKLLATLASYVSLSKFACAFFKINKNNRISHKTFSHLGAKIIKENEKSYTYCIKRTDLQNYIKINKF